MIEKFGDEPIFGQGMIGYIKTQRILFRREHLVLSPGGDGRVAQFVIFGGKPCSGIEEAHLARHPIPGIGLGRLDCGIDGGNHGGSVRILTGQRVKGSAFNQSFHG